MENSPEYVAAYFGTLLAGGVAVPLDCKAPPQALARVLNDCDVYHWAISPTQARIAQKTLEHDTPVRWALLSDECLTSNKARLLNVRQLKPRDINVRSDPASPAVINYTSGSSGQPKGVTVSHKALVANTRSIVASLGLTCDDRVMQILPFSYCYGASLLHTHFMVGGSVVIDNRFLYPSAVMANLAKSCCTGFAGVPSTFHTLVSKCDLRASNFPNLRYMTQAGGRMAPELVDKVRSLIAPALLYVMYGQTEASSRLTCLHPAQWNNKRGSVGRPIPGVKLKILSETGTEMPIGESGEICVHGENLMMGYWNQPDETANVLKNGWLRTGDIGRIDKDGFLFIEGRLKAIIKSNGYRISPCEIEEVFSKHPAVHEALVLGLPNSGTGETISAAVSLETGFHVTETELARHCMQNLPPHKVPRRIVLVKELPKSAAGKIVREEVLKLFEGP
jgi:acyl-CoA synthetase (AMP-forming)/AMP-acid ligase II